MAETEQKKLDERWDQIMGQIMLQTDMLAKQEAQFSQLFQLHMKQMQNNQ